MREKKRKMIQVQSKKKRRKKKEYCGHFELKWNIERK